MSLEEIGTELRSWIDGEQNIKLDKWFKDYGEDFLYVLFFMLMYQVVQGESRN